MNQEIFDQIQEEEEEYLPRPRARIPQRFSYEKTHTPTQLMLAEMEPKFGWTNSTLFKDRQAYYALAHKVLAEKGEVKLAGILNWCREKRVHIRAVIKLLSQAIK